MSVRITWLRLEERLEHEFRQLREEGIDATDLEQQWANLPLETRAAEAGRLLDEAGRLTAHVAETEPLFDAGVNLEKYDLQKCLTAAWTGRMAGCLLGKPVEKVTRVGIRAILESNNRYPLNDYFTSVGVPDELLELHPWNKDSRATSLQENMICMPEDDDINYTMLNLHVLEMAGVTFSTDDVAKAWLEMLPVLTVFTAERVAYFNLLEYREAPQTATYRNPYREWIGAQIRADIFGWVSPSNPARAAALAWRDARLSHTGNGLYAEMFVAAMAAAAFDLTSPRAVIEAGLAVIPKDSRLAEAIMFTLTLPDLEPDWEKAVDQLYAQFGHYHWVHAINNAALVAAALLYGQGDFSRSICLAVSGGWDTDCNGATVGSIVGIMTQSIPERWSKPLNNHVRSSLRGFDYSTIDSLVARTLAVMKDL